ncbi:PGF-CTERM sorting domain-containing protein [Halobaculum gomorrense]|uniref:PGF-CTERM sorting domain-containing protein n=1 Tax=Halobaculum gomorrense TaxID=43928 RepID=UPI00135634D5|nr:PGF-CTERM sorting domain-containing protein [Halobaculum gomorrense]
MVVLAAGVAGVSGLTTSGGTVSGIPSSTGVVAPDTVINGSTDSDIEIGYNVTAYIEDGSQTLSDLTLGVIWPNGWTSINLTESDGIITVTIPAGTVAGGEHVYSALVYNRSSGQVVGTTPAVDDGALTATTSVTIDSYTVSNTTVEPGEQFWVNTTLNNTGTNEDRFTVAVYQFNQELANRTVSVGGGERRVINLSLTLDREGTSEIRVNQESATTVTVNDTTSADETTSAGIQVKSASVVSTEVPTGEQFSVNVTLNNTASTEQQQNIRVDGFGTVYTDERISNSTTVTVPGDTVKTVQLNVTAPNPNRFDLLLPDGTRTTGFALADGTHIALTNVGTNVTAVVGEETFLAATAHNLGDAKGFANQTVVWNGTVLGSWNRTVNSTEQKSVGWLVQFPERVDAGTVMLGDRTANLTVREPVVASSNVTCIAGPCPESEIVADLGLDANMLQGSLKTQAGSSLDTTNATTQTRFRVELVTQNFSAPVLIGTGHNATWNRTTINSTHTRHVVKVTASEFDLVEGARLGAWPTGADDTATFHRNATVDLAFDPMDQYATSTEPRERFNGTIIMTDAQTFGQLEYQSGGALTEPKLSLLVAGPHFKPDGETVNEGYYEAFLPGSLLSSWGVTDPGALTAAYAGNSTSISAQNESGGIVVEIPIHYSAGTVSIQPAVSGTSENETTDSSGPSDTSPNTGDDVNTDSSSSNTDSSNDSDTSGSPSESDDSDTSGSPSDTAPSSSTNTSSKSITENRSAVTATVTPETPRSTATPEATTTNATPTESPSPSETPTERPSTAQSETDTRTTSSESGRSETSTAGPGFGVVGAVLALLSVAVLATRRS